jgi:molybdenum-dependent DNA-binding transcriptional regulator ModE
MDPVGMVTGALGGGGGQQDVQKAVVEFGISLVEGFKQMTEQVVKQLEQNEAKHKAAMAENNEE